MYAIESKKRKFDRVLDSISRHTPGDLPTRDTAKKIRLSGSTSSIPTDITSTFLPSSREAFLRRLETFGPITRWHIPSNEPINAAAWAKRGWICAAKDTVSCGSCGARLLVELDKDAKENIPQENDNQEERQKLGGEASDEEDAIYTMEQEVHAGLVAKYSEMVTSAHREDCPWQHKGCDRSIQRIEGLLNAPGTVSVLHERLKGLEGPLPHLKIPAVHLDFDNAKSLVGGDFSEDLIERVAGGESRDAYLLAMCGWRAPLDKDLVDAVECGHCFRRLGLWLYRGGTMERLDAVENHLEYCPWRSPDAQDTWLTVLGENVPLPGWALVARAVAREEHNGGTGQEPPRASINTGTMDAPESPVEREKKMKELLRKVKELKKPFNVKSLLRKTKKPT